MWFNNLHLFQYEYSKDLDLTSALAQDLLKPCPPHARFIYGWTAAQEDELVHEISGCALIQMGKEERILPRGVIKKALAEKIQAIETKQGRKIKRAEKSQLAEELEFELLPKSFCIQKKLGALFDTVNKHLLINTSSANQASQLLALLRKSIPGLHVEPIASDVDLSGRFTQWINHPASLPSPFQLASNCILFSLDDEKKQFNCKGYELPADEVLSLLSQGLAAAEISLIWNERIQFTLTHNLVLKRIKCLDYLTDEFTEIHQLEDDYQQQDAALALLSGELRGLLTDLLKAVSPSEGASSGQASQAEVSDLRVAVAEAEEVVL